jgi:alpha-methylacyl-CoA racemase
LLAGLGLRAEDVPDRDDRSVWPALRELFTGMFASRTRDDWAEVFAGTDSCVTPVLTVAEAESDPHLVARGEFHYRNGQLEVTAAPRFSRSTPGVGGLAQWTELDAVLAAWPTRSPQQ